MSSFHDLRGLPLQAVEVLWTLPRTWRCRALQRGAGRKGEWSSLRRWLRYINGRVVGKRRSVCPFLRASRLDSFQTLNCKQSISVTKIFTYIYRLLYAKINVKILQFLNQWGTRVNRIKQQNLALPISSTLDSYDGRQLILQTQQITVCYIIIGKLTKVDFFSCASGCV